jgi:signal transduction histidine kinase
MLLLFVFPAAAADTTHDITVGSQEQIAAQFSQQELEFIAAKKSVVMCTDPNWMPYEKFDTNGYYIGVAADYHKTISRITGLEYKFLRTASWPETLEKAKAGECDILSILNATPERNKYLDFSDSYIESPSVFVTRESDKFINGITDLNGKTLAIVKGYMVDELIRVNHPEISRIYADSIPEALAMVSKGKAFATVGSLLEMSYNIRQLGMLNLKITGDAKFGYELRIGVRKGDALLLSVMNKALQSITKEERDRILNKWISIKYQKSYDYSFIWKIVAVFSVLFLIFAGRMHLTSKYNCKLLLLNKDLTEAKLALENINKNLEAKVALETSKRLENERLLMQQSKLAAMGDMIGAIAHQWRQPLNAIGLLVQDLEDAYDSETFNGELLKESVHSSMKIITQMSATIDDFSNFFRPDKNMECFRLCVVISEIAGIFTPQLSSHGISIDLRCMDSDLNSLLHKDSTSFSCCSSMRVKGYPNEFKHVIMNLVKNAMDAHDSTKKDKKFLKISIRTDSDQFAVIQLQDNAGGIDKSVASRIFEPYFSTKEEGKGVGIGLYMSRQIVNNMNGKIWFETSEEGTSFFIKLRICDSE